MIKKFLAFIAELNSTNAVVVTGIVITLATAARYLLSGVHVGPFGFDEFNPDVDWLITCLAVMGVGTTQFGVKRSTDIDYMKAKMAAASAARPEVTVETANVQAGDVTVQPKG